MYVQRGDDPRLGDGDALLFHGFVNGHAVAFSHLVELVCDVFKYKYDWNGLEWSNGGRVDVVYMYEDGLMD